MRLFAFTSVKMAAWSACQYGALPITWCVRASVRHGEWPIGYGDALGRLAQPGAWDGDGYCRGRKDAGDAVASVRPAVGCQRSGGCVR